MQQTIATDTPSHHQELKVPGPKGTLLHTRVWGNLEDATSAIVAVHGIYQSSRCWYHQAALVTTGAVVIAFDLPFHGETMTPDTLLLDEEVMAQSIHAIIDFFALQEFPLFLMGWSFGAWCIGTYLQRYGIKHLRGLILVSGLFGDINQCLSLLQEQHKPALEAMSMLINPETPPTSVLTMEASALAATQQFLTRLRYPSSRRKNAAEEDAAELGYNIRAVSRMRSSGINPFAIIAQQTFDGLYEQFNQASLPVCLLAGKQDAILPIEWFRLLASQFTSIETHEQEQCGHSFFAEYPETFNSAVGTFVNTCLSRQIINDMHAQEHN